MLKLMRRGSICGFAVCLATVLFSCSSKDANTVVGKWSKGNDTIVTFTKEGKCIQQEGTGTVEMDYTVQDGTNLYLKPSDMPMSIVFIIAFPSSNEMVLTPQPPKGAIAPPQSLEPAHFTRVVE